MEEDSLTIRKLRDSQLATFDTDYMFGRRWTIIHDHIRHSFPDGKFAFVDLGGGSGAFCDNVLADFPDSNGVLLDNAEILLERNKSHPRKRLINESVENLTHVLQQERFDLVFLNGVLHHFVCSSYRDTREMQRSVLRDSIALLTPGGRISIFENLAESFVGDGFPGAFIHYLTRSKLLAPITGRLGANTAGTGVCFLSRRQWTREFQQLGMRSVAVTTDTTPEIPLYKRMVLNLRDFPRAHFWLEPMNPDSKQSEIKLRS